MSSASYCQKCTRKSENSAQPVDWSPCSSQIRLNCNLNKTRRYFSYKYNVTAIHSQLTKTSNVMQRSGHHFKTMPKLISIIYIHIHKHTTIRYSICTDSGQICDVYDSDSRPPMDVQHAAYIMNHWHKV